MIMRPSRVQAACSLIVATFLAAATLLAPARARAQAATGFALDQYDPSVRGSDWFANESLDLRGHVRPAIGVVADYSYRPLAIYNTDGSFRSAIVADQLFFHVGGSLVLWDRLRVEASLPVLAHQDGDGGSLGGTTFAKPGAVNIGDPRLGADVRLFGAYGDAFTVAAGAQVYLPLGSRADYTGDQEVRLQPRLTVAGDISQFTYAARIGFEYHAYDSDFAGSPIGSQLTYGAAAGVRLADHKLTVGPEAFGAATVSGDQFFKARTTPVEGLFGAHYLIADQVRIGAGVGAGLTRGYGAPLARGLLVVEWAPGIKQKPRDRDGDGIVDDEDACPDVPGVATPDPATNGCPPPPPAEPPPPAPPPPDRDGDGIVDADDACPDVPGIATTDPKTNGCPPDPDRDKDGILNDQDACPDEPGPANPDPKKNGCPQAVVRNNQIVILEQVKFATASAVILPASDALLNAVLNVFVAHPEIKKVSVEGHTDNVGAPPYNKKLSGQRAAAVVAWLTKRGLDPSRLTSAGFGMEKPIDTNGTSEGRQNNRRVEFHIVDPPPGVDSTQVDRP
jgi:outer membrane protein OmpA-like peptidoglycan-associated protein